jgi:hypothetical protein
MPVSFAGVAQQVVVKLIKFFGRLRRGRHPGTLPLPLTSIRSPEQRSTLVVTGDVNHGFIGVAFQAKLTINSVFMAYTARSKAVFEDFNLWTQLCAVQRKNKQTKRASAGSNRPPTTASKVIFSANLHVWGIGYAAYGIICGPM